MITPSRDKSTAPLLRTFLANRDGAVTTEFVIIFPIVIGLLFLITFVSLLVSTASDVQQVAHELARAAFPYAAQKAEGADICATLRTSVLPRLIEQSLLLSPDKFTLLPCPAAPDAQGFITMQITYNMAGDYVAELGRNFGLNLGSLARSATTHF